MYRLIQDDNLTAMASIEDETIDLVYADPPFFSQKDYKDYDDRWDSRDSYLKFMEARLIEIRRTLKPTGSLYLHCNHRTSHYLKVLLDTIFREDNFRGEIIWHYRTSGGAPKGWLIRNHDVILAYAKRLDLARWNPIKEQWPKSTLKKWQRDEEGKIYRHQHKFDTRYYIDPDGKLADDVWDLTFTSRTSERVGYPTQKPLALLERIIACSSNPEDLVLDPFCGSGTTLVAARNLDRHSIGIDSSKRAIELAEQRLSLNSV